MAITLVGSHIAINLYDPLRQWLKLSSLEMTALVIAVATPLLIFGIRLTWRHAEAPRKALEQRYAEEDAQLLKSYEQAQRF